MDGATELQRIGAVVESIAFLVAVNVLAMQRAAPLQRLTITGGLAACDYLCEVLADATQMTVERPALLEATSRGIAFLAAGQPQDWQPVPIERSFAPAGGIPRCARFDEWRAAMAVRVERRSRPQPASNVGQDLAARPRSARPRRRRSRSARRDASA